MRKIIIGIPLTLFSALALLIAWANFGPSEGVEAEPEIEDVSKELSAKKYIKIAWDDWNSGGWNTDDYDKNLAFIAIRSIDSRDMAVLGVNKEFSDLKKIAGNLNGNLGRLSDEEKSLYVEEFRKKLEVIHTSIN